MKILDKIFGKKVKYQAQPDVDESYKKVYEDERKARKLEWEKKNELAKKLDACHLGMTHQAFNGTYEEYQFQLSANYWQNASMAGLNASQQAAQQNVNYFYGMQGYANPITRIFG